MADYFSILSLYLSNAANGIQLSREASSASIVLPKQMLAKAWDGLK